MKGTQKEDTGKSMKNALYLLRCDKRQLTGWCNVKQWKIKPIVLAIIEPELSVGQLIQNSIK